MAPLKVFLPAALLIAGLEFVAGGCGNASPPPRLLLSVSVTPATANAQTFSGGQVQFAALGTYSQPPSPSPITEPGWSLSDTTIATISQSGLAQCNPGASGVVTVRGSTPAPCSGTACTAVLLSGTAQLTCP